ncbi:phage holin [Candidatus Enterococcus mansonii]|uniref:SPP1 family holin n=1 Tax=Candidatus Enterococcus mansonii TaxID=1834181 RepID=A0A242CFF7_9ENTE|nr:phage holin [Enterococcus sp. 4G2_DIV0659]OTO08512.1 SPP1 family holin [Enterococcus sp. 4G2_DIV0659]
MKQASANTIARTIILFLALFNQILAITGKGTLDIVEDTIYQVVSLIFTIVSTGITWWKNNSFTHAAIKADEILEELKKDGEYRKNDSMDE